MERQQNIGLATLLLSFIAGYCDIVTFASADNIFSAHVTGNFIVFVCQVLNGSDGNNWIKLLTFPIFIISVVIGGWIAFYSTNRFLLLLIEGIILVASGLIPWLFRISNVSSGEWITYMTAMFIVFAIGLQNAFGKLYADETYAPTTMMTGNVTLLSLNIGTLIRARFDDAISLLSFKKLLVAIGGFLAGCFLGGLMSIQFGLSAVIFPGLAMIICYIKKYRQITNLAITV